jgi:prephenate dehydrogenase
MGSIRACWKACGGVINYLEPARHDALFAAVSHLPHALAFASRGDEAHHPATLGTSA